MHRKFIALLLCLSVSLAPCLPAQAAAKEKTVTKKAETQKAVPILKIKNTSTGLCIQWKRATGIGGYYVFRRRPGEAWQKMTDVTTVKTIRWTDTTAKNGELFEYMVVGYKRFKVTGVKITETVPAETENAAADPGSSTDPSDASVGNASSSGSSGSNANASNASGGNTNASDTSGSNTNVSDTSGGNTNASDTFGDNVNSSDTTGAAAPSAEPSGETTTGSSGGEADTDRDSRYPVSDGSDGSTGIASSSSDASVGSSSIASSSSDASGNSTESGSDVSDPAASKEDSESGDSEPSENEKTPEMITVTRTEYDLPENAYIGYKKLTEPTTSGTPVTACRLKAPVLKTAKMTSSTACKVTWEKRKNITGYLLQYAPNRTFTGAKTITIASADSTSQVIKNLNRKKTWYVRICTYRKSGKLRLQSAWTSCSKAKTAATVRVSKLKKGKSVLELRAASSQSMYGYDTVQGSCCDGVRSYHVMYNRSRENCMIVRMNLATKKIEKKSAVLPIHHGNDITFNADTGKLVVVHMTGSPFRLTEIDPATLKVTANHDVKLPTYLYGAPEKTIASISGFTAVAYDATEHRYAVRIRGSRNFLVLDQDFTPVRYVTNTCPYSFTNQGIECSGDYILCAQSPSSTSRYNALVVLDWDGNYITRILVSGINELESTYLHNSVLYGNTYQSGYRYETVKKTVMVKKKKKVKGKKKYRTVYVKKTVRVRVRRLYRDNHIFKLTSF